MDMRLRVLIAASITVLGLGLGLRELLEHHWFAGAGFVCSALLTGGLIVVGRDFLEQSLIGAGLAVGTAVFGFYGFFFENRAFDVALDQARFEAAMALAQPDTPCTAPGSTARFQAAMQACFLQANRDKLAAVGEGARQAYVPPALDLADKLLTQAHGEARDACREQFAALHAACPASFASMDEAAVKRLTAPR